MLSAHIFHGLSVISTFAEMAAAGLVVVVALVLLAGILWYTSHRKKVGSSVTPSDHFRLIAEASGDVFFKVAPASEQIIWAGDVGEQFLGYRPGKVNLQPSTFDKWVDSRDLEKVQSAWGRLLQGERIDVEVRLRTNNGQRCWVHLLAVSTEETEKTGCRAAGVVRKTHDFHELQAELGEARRLQTVGTMASGIAHEFNNHLTPIRGFIELALDSLRDDPIAEGLKTALNRVEYCAELVSQVQAYGRKSLLLPEPVNLPRLLPSVVRVAMTSYRANAHEIALQEEYPAVLPNVWLDQSQFQQAVVQLIRNALESMPDGGKLTIRVESMFVAEADLPGRREARKGNFVCISVMDTGVGIHPENLERIFDPFFTTHKRADKRGMGLPMVQGVVAQHGGWMEIKSELGKGTEVRLFFPREEVEEKQEEVAIDADGTMHVLPAAPVGRVLIGDDEELIRKLIRKMFAGEGWMVEEARDFDEVMQRVDDAYSHFDLMVLDLAMNGPPAEEVMKQIVQKRPEAKILIISGYGRDDRVEKLLQVTGGDFMAKPFSPKDLLSRVDGMVGSG